eukprot:15361869-Ditylum_brightwellii.AAC.2
MERVYRKEEYDHQEDSSVDVSDLEEGDDNDEYGDIISVEDEMDAHPSSEAQRYNVHKKG